MTEPIEGFPQDLLERLCKHTTRDRVLETLGAVQITFNVDRDVAVSIIESALKVEEAFSLAGMKVPTDSVN